MKTMEEFFAEVMADRKLAQALREAEHEGRLDAFLESQGVEGSGSAFETVVDEKHELSDEELVMAAGGSNLVREGAAGSRMVQAILFEIGQRVQAQHWFWMGGKGTVVGVSEQYDTKRGGWFPKYLVRLDEGGREKWFWQKALSRE